ncbi:general stress protein [Ensifer sp.]|uniref:general stress protein n=1 Tax=Ensifer sp. TaxID=1872086 RepID=UPI0028974F19|nr:general stress protein [Ensifer sp.]
MRTVTGLFDNYDDATNAVAQLEAAGVPSTDISIIANNADNRYSDRYSDGDSNAGEGAGAGAGLGAAGGGALGLLTGLGLMAIPGVGPVVAAGWLATTAAGAAAGAVAGGAVGGIIGAMTESGVSEEDAHLYAEGVRRGGSVVTARVDEGLVDEAEVILRNNSVDPIGRRQAYADTGWRRFDDQANAYTSTEIEDERRRYDRTL